MLGEIDGADIGAVFSQAIELLWAQRFGDASIAEEKSIAPQQALEPEKAIESQKEKKKKIREGEKERGETRGGKGKAASQSIQEQTRNRAGGDHIIKGTPWHPCRLAKEPALGDTLVRAIENGVSHEHFRGLNRLSE
ncbi:hypothetical protein E4P82_07975 [Candidatus Competibacter phosphatis]|uniref:Uncharacterized protein n=1 Tax=Candidatus Competibacter phosphatis TaxID=221280 RepID=A0ABX1TKN9_9GAMM|nr:hypothetical protein [Candidatus Competibacter phosphatis]NMQ19144.1 hypothetical protein [Candidatus Competibacter phosphatis]